VKVHQNSFCQSVMRFNLALITIALVLLFPFVIHSEIIDRIAAIVDDDIITQSEVSAMEKLQLNVSGLPKAESTLADRINHHLLVQQIQRQPPPTVTPEMIRDTTESITREHGGNEELLVFLNSIGMNYEDFDNELREQLSIREFINLRFRPFVNVKIEEAEDYYNNVYKLEFEAEGKSPPSFAESFETIQSVLAASRVLERTKEWLDQLKKEASIYVKE
jgi:parvulin-like peptidyl-prolyl isomerase